MVPAGPFIMIAAGATPHPTPLRGATFSRKGRRGIEARSV